ncbi:MAG: ABC transporter permease [Sedimentisphaerales bacterium]|nr:ABC transporter permease [Sedimentisphaerales bacterium]
MINYIIRRLLYAIPIIFGVLLLNFSLFNLAGGDLSLEIAGKGADAETIAEIRHEYGWDKPLFLSWDSQFVNHFENALTFDFGRALDRELVIDKVKRGIAPTLALMVPMFIGIIVISISLALVVAFVRGTAWDTVTVLICVLGMSMPFLSFILIGQYFFAYKWGWFPVFFSPELDTYEYVALPILIGIAAGIGGNLRFYRTVMLDEMRNDYVRTAFAKGLTTRKVLFKHVLKNAMIPIITRVVLAIPFLLLGSLLLERFFGIPGLGYLLVEAVNTRDLFVLNFMTFISALLVIVFNLLTDICYAFVDPRIRLD